MKGRFGSRTPAAGMMSFVTNGRKSDTAALVKDEDLSLFRELHQQKRRNQLLNPLSVSDEFDTTFPFPTHHDHPSGNYQIFRIPSDKRGSAGSDFLAENDKHDYDWLKTPPATPLFPSIEMEAAANNNNNAQQKENAALTPPLLQRAPRSRFAGGNNNSEVSPRPSNNNIIGNIDVEKPAAHSQKSKPPATSKSDVVHKPSSSITSTNYTKTSGTNSISSASKERQYHNLILGYSNETPPNLRTEQRSSSTTRGRVATAVVPQTRPRQKSCSPSVTRGRKAEPILTVNNNKLLQAQEKSSSTTSTVKGTVVVGSRMVEKVMNARKSAIISASSSVAANNNNNNNNNNTSTTSSIVNIKAGHRLKLDTNPNYSNSRPHQNSAAAFGLARNNHNCNMIISKTLISREKARSK